MTTALKTIHKDECVRVFSRYDLTCDRCIELAGGAEARAGWSRPVSTYVFKSCGHGNLNPGGYCKTCGNGRDFS